MLYIHMKRLFIYVVRYLVPVFALIDCKCSFVAHGLVWLFGLILYLLLCSHRKSLICCIHIRIVPIDKYKRITIP